MTGPAGAPGDAGATGATGPTGTLASAYLDAYASSNTTVAPGSNFAFDTIQASSGIVAAGPGNTTFTVTSAGKYLVTIGVAGDNHGAPIQLEANGLGAGPQITLSSTEPGGMSGGFTRILSLNAGDVITLINASGIPENNDVGSAIEIVRIA